MTRKEMFKLCQSLTTRELYTLMRTATKELLENGEDLPQEFR